MNLANKRIATGFFGHEASTFQPQKTPCTEFAKPEIAGATDALPHGRDAAAAPVDFCNAVGLCHAVRRRAHHGKASRRVACAEPARFTMMESATGEYDQLYPFNN